MHHEIYRADVDAQFHRGGCYQHFQFAGLQFLLGGKAVILAHAAVVRTYGVLPQPLRQRQCQAFRQAPGVDEYQRRVVGSNQLHQALVQLFPDLVTHQGGQWRTRYLDTDINLSPKAGVHDFTGHWRQGAIGIAHQVARHRRDGLLGG